MRTSRTSELMIVSLARKSWSGELRRTDRVFDTDPASPSYGKLKQDGRKLYGCDERACWSTSACAAASMFQGAREVFWGECQSPACGCGERYCRVQSEEL